MTGDTQGEAHVLLDHQDRESLFSIEALNRLENLLHQQG